MGPYGSEDQSADLRLKSPVRPWIPVHHDPPYVSDHLAQAPDEHGAAVEPCLVAVDEDEVDDGKGCKVGAEECIGAETGIVAIDCQIDGALQSD